MPDAWDIEKGDNSIILAFIDSGADMDHDDLEENLWTNSVEVSGTSGIDDDGNGYIDDRYGWDTRDNDNNPNDTNGHGTLSAGIACARSNNSAGVAGIAGGWNTTPGVKLMVLRSGSITFEEADVAEAIDYARENGANVISISLEGDDALVVRTAVADAINSGIVVIAATGNSGTSRLVSRQDIREL